MKLLINQNIWCLTPKDHNIKTQQFLLYLTAKGKEKKCAEIEGFQQVCRFLYCFFFLWVKTATDFPKSVESQTLNCFIFFVSVLTEFV
jgi:hypothetical protein